MATSSPFPLILPKRSCWQPGLANPLPSPPPQKPQEGRCNDSLASCPTPSPTARNESPGGGGGAADVPGSPLPFPMSLSISPTGLPARQGVLRGRCSVGSPTPYSTRFLGGLSFTHWVSRLRPAPAPQAPCDPLPHLPLNSHLPALKVSSAPWGARPPMLLVPGVMGVQCPAAPDLGASPPHLSGRASAVERRVPPLPPQNL